jgi:hypothetical protein
MGARLRTAARLACATGGAQPATVSTDSRSLDPIVNGLLPNHAGARLPGKAWPAPPGYLRDQIT